jgi:dTDP-glucose 4,6-dehydratase
LGDKGFDVAIARCFSFVGPYLPRDQHFAIGNFIESGLKGNSIVVKANHPVYRSYLYADDLVSWLMIILKSAVPSCPIVNVGSDQEILIIDLAAMVGSYFGVKVCYPKQDNEVIDRYVPGINKAILMGCPRPMKICASIEATVKAIKKLS